MDTPKGYLLNPKGNAKCITQEERFTAGPDVAAAYASRSWSTSGELLADGVAALESQWLEDQFAAPYEWTDAEAA